MKNLFNFTLEKIIFVTAGQPIQAEGVMDRIHADLIDVSAWSVQGFRYILQVKDHFSKFVWVYALQHKDCDTIVKHIRAIFCQFGTPRILQTDNGGEFKGRQFIQLLAEFPGVKCIHSRPRHPQTQGLIERANQTLERRLGSYIEENGRENWPIALEKIGFAINRSFSRVIGTTPFEIMFNRKPRNPNQEAEIVELAQHRQESEIENTSEPAEIENLLDDLTQAAECDDSFDQSAQSAELGDCFDDHTQAAQHDNCYEASTPAFDYQNVLDQNESIGFAENEEHPLSEGNGASHNIATAFGGSWTKSR